MIPTPIIPLCPNCHPFLPNLPSLSYIAHFFPFLLTVIQNKSTPVLVFENPLWKPLTFPGIAMILCSQDAHGWCFYLNSLQPSLHLISHNHSSGSGLVKTNKNFRIAKPHDHPSVLSYLSERTQPPPPENLILLCD